MIKFKNIFTYKTRENLYIETRCTEDQKATVFKNIFTYKTRENLYIETRCIKFFTVGKGFRDNEYQAEGCYTTIHLLSGGNCNDMEMDIENNPVSVNCFLFDDLFIKFTACHVQQSDNKMVNPFAGEMIKYLVWVNPECIVMASDLLPNTTEIRFTDHKIIIIDDKLKNVVSKLIDHKTQYLERIKNIYGKK